MVITLTRQAWCGATSIGAGVARTLGIRCIDRELLTSAAASLGRDEAELAEREERLSTRWERLVKAFSGFAVGAPEAACMPEPPHVLDDHGLFTLQSEIMADLARRQDCVVVGRAASWVLRGLAGHVPILIHAPIGWRAHRLLSSGKVRNGDEAVAVLERSDRCRADFLRKMTGSDWMSAPEYALTLDPSRSGIEGAIALIVAFARSTATCLGAASARRATDG